MSTVGFKFSLLQAASTAEDVAPWVHSVRKWVMVSGVLQCWQHGQHAGAAQTIYTG